MRTRLPLTALRALDAAARLGSFTAAAADLGVTRPAVSKQIFARNTERQTPAEAAFRGWLFATVRSHQKAVEAYLLENRISMIQRSPPA